MGVRAADPASAIRHIAKQRFSSAAPITSDDKVPVTVNAVGQWGHGRNQNLSQACWKRVQVFALIDQPAVKRRYVREQSKGAMTGSATVLLGIRHFFDL